MIKIKAIAKIADANISALSVKNDGSWLDSISDPHSIITPTENYIYFPETLDGNISKYTDNIHLFSKIISDSNETSDILFAIRDGSYSANVRMSLLKLFRRCVAPVLDTEMTKKIKTVTTESLVANYGNTFKDIKTLKSQFSNLDINILYALCALLGEYDNRGTVGYELTDVFFDWFEKKFSGELNIKGPRGAGKDIELREYISDFNYSYPCDFIVTDNDKNVIAVGFARYDSTRGGSQADDRTGGNSDKVWKAIDYNTTKENKKPFKLIFLSDGPGLAHKDIWAEFCELDKVRDNVRVTTLKTLNKRITKEWLLS